MYSKNLDNLYNSKYLKYKNKYLSLKKLVGGVRHKMVFINFDGVERPNPDNSFGYFYVDENLVLQNYVAEYLNMPPESIFLSFNSNFISSNNLSIDPIKSSTRLKDILGDNIRIIEIDVESLVKLNIHYNNNNNICYVRKNDLIKKVVGDCLKKNPGELHVSMDLYTIQKSDYVQEYIRGGSNIINLTVIDDNPQSSSMSTLMSPGPRSSFAISAVPWSSKSTPGKKSLSVSSRSFVPVARPGVPQEDRNGSSDNYTIPHFTDKDSIENPIDKLIEIQASDMRRLGNNLLERTTSRTNIASNDKIRTMLPTLVYTLQNEKYNINLIFKESTSPTKNIYINIFFLDFPNYSGTISFHEKDPLHEKKPRTHIKWYKHEKENTEKTPIMNKEDKTPIRQTYLELISNTDTVNLPTANMFVKDDDNSRSNVDKNLAIVLSKIEDIILYVLYEVLLHDWV